MLTQHRLPFPLAKLITEIGMKAIWDKKGSGPSWDKKVDKMVWWGIASGGRNRENTWSHFHGHRFVSMVNGTSVSLAETGSIDRPPTLQRLPRDILPESGRDNALGDWVSNFNDAAFLDLVC